MTNRESSHTPFPVNELLVEGADEQNRSNNRPFQDVLRARLSRRATIQGGLGLAALGFLSPLACGDDDDDVVPPPSPSPSGDAGVTTPDTGVTPPDTGVTPDMGTVPDMGTMPPDAGMDGGMMDGGTTIQTSLGFDSIGPSNTDACTIAAGYDARVLYAFGDPIAAGIDPWRNDGTDDPLTYDRRCGTGHDGMHYFPLRPGTTPGNIDRNAEYYSESSDRGLLVLNHENIFVRNALHEGGGPSTNANGNRPFGEVMRELYAHGVSVVEIAKDGNGDFQVVPNSPFNRRIHAITPMDLSGPVAGTNWVYTQYSPTGMSTRGTLNNCANGYTPWGTYLTCEENWHGYFRTSEDPRPESKTRFGVDGTSSYGWETAEGAPAGFDPTTFTRFDTSATGTDATQDFRNEANTYGYVVEIDPYDPNARPIKRTALGRFRHEGCWPSRAIEGQPLAFYSGDDAQNEYIYKFVTADNYSRATSNGSMLDNGTLYVARFDDDGTGQWLELSMNNPTIADSMRFSGRDQAEILIHTRVAADIVGATPMDRPEWGAVNPMNGEVYMTLTNNSRRTGADPTRPAPDAANPRNYDVGEGNPDLDGNANGHIIRWREDGDRADATSFTWDIFIFGSRAGNRPENLSGLDESNAFSSPDGLWFDPGVQRGVIWIQTDDGALQDFTNDQILAAIPGTVGDGGMQMVDGVGTYIGRDAAANQLKRFMVGPNGCEMTGIAVTPDGQTMFVNVQHPGGSGNDNNWPAASRDATELPDNQPQGGLIRSRPATVVITRQGGGVVGGP